MFLTQGNSKDIEQNISPHASQVTSHELITNNSFKNVTYTMLKELMVSQKYQGLSKSAIDLP